VLGELAGRDVDVWAVQLFAPDTVVERCLAVLSPDERARAERFVFQRHRRAFVLSRGILRRLLGRYTSQTPAAIGFSYGRKGKPCLLELARHIQFNCSHSADMTLYAMTRHCDLGVDVEKIRPLQDVAEIAQPFFCPEEVRELFSLPAAEREAVFFRCWTRKEAYIKAVGDGLAIPLDSFRLTMAPGDPAGFVHFDNDATLAREWTLHDFPAIPGYASAIAYRDAPRPLRWDRVMTAAEILAFLESA